MTHCNGCPFAADCSGPCALDPIVAVMPRALADMTVAELRVERANAVEDGHTSHAELVDQYIIAYYQAREDYDELHHNDDPVEDEIRTICAGCTVSMGERDDSTYYAGQHWCTDCAGPAS